MTLSVCCLPLVSAIQRRYSSPKVQLKLLCLWICICIGIHTDNKKMLVGVGRRLLLGLCAKPLIFVFILFLI